MPTAGDNDTSRAGGDISQLLPTFIGDLHAVLMERIPPLVQLSAAEREQRGLDGLAELREHDVLTDLEVARLTTILQSLRPENGTPRERADRVAEIQRELTTANSGPVALVIAAVAADSTKNVAKVVEEAPEGADVEITTWAQADVVGGIVGATGGLVAGLLGGGPVAVLEGAAGGAVAGSVAFVVAHRLIS